MLKDCCEVYNNCNDAGQSNEWIGEYLLNERGIYTKQDADRVMEEDAAKYKEFMGEDNGEATENMNAWEVIKREAKNALIRFL